MARKGLHRFLVDRVLRLGVPMVFFVIFLSPFVEYVDSENVGWDRGFAAFTLDIWWPPAPGPTWFLGVLLLFAAAITVTSYLVRLEVPLAEERYRLALGQAPAWTAAFTFGVVGGERGWFDSLTPRVIRAAGTMTLAAVVPWATVLVFVAATDGDMDPFLAGAPGSRSSWR
ncbi:MAG: acyltransferase family protein [Nocardioidaceae bacterium]